MSLTCGAGRSVGEAGRPGRPAPWRRTLVPALVGLALVVSAVPAWSAEEPALRLATRLHASAQDGRLDVGSEDAPLGEVLDRISQVAGVTIVMDASLRDEVAAEPVTARFAGVTVEEGLERLLPGRSLIALYEQGRLVEVRVYRGPQPGAAATAPRASRAAREGAAREERRPAPPRAPEAEGQLSLEAAAEALRRPADTAAVERALDAFRDAERVPLEPLLEFAATDRDADLRSQALEVLVEKSPGDPRVRELLRNMAARDKDEDARDTARELLEGLDRR